MKATTINLIEACDTASGIITQAREMDKLYRKAIQCLGEGNLRSGVMSLAAEAIGDEKLSQEVFLSDENMVSFLCGVWIQFLLVEVAGLKKDKLKDLAQKSFRGTREKRAFALTCRVANPFASAVSIDTGNGALSRERPVIGPSQAASGEISPADRGYCIYFC